MNKEETKLYNDRVSKILAIRDVFNDFFGEDNVDLQNLGEDLEELRTKGSPYILVHWDKVRITNENDKFIDIQDLYARIVITESGHLVEEIALNRTTYPLSQYRCNYMHSHVSGIPECGEKKDFQFPCFGHGPINGTMATLYNDFDLDMWNLLCLELDKYVHHESLTGGPYFKLETIINPDNPTRYFDPITFVSLLDATKAITTVAKEVSEYMLSNYLVNIVYNNGILGIGMSEQNLRIAVSNALIKLYNSTSSTLRGVGDEGFIKSLFVTSTFDKDGRLVQYRHSNGSGDYQDDEDEFVLKFKGEDKVIHIIDDTNVNEDNTNDFLILREWALDPIVINLYEIILTNNDKDYKSLGSESASRTDKKILFI